MMKIYKYASIDSALEILEQNKLLLHNPLIFNDPFDTNIKRDEKDVAKVRKITVAFSTLTLLIQCCQTPEIEQAIKRNPLFVNAKKEYQILVKMLKKDPRFKGNFAFTSLYKILGLKSDQFKERAEKQLKDFEQKINESIEKTKREALATCFSKRYDSLLMWAHYAKSHTGVCIEYERPDEINFVDVIYSKKRPKLKLEEMVSFMAGKTILAEDYNTGLNEKIMKETMKPFITKSLEWKYEQEVRCLITKNSPLKELVFENDEYYFKMPKPTCIYIGCRAKGKTKDSIVKVAKKNKIKYVFLKEHPDDFSILTK